MFTHHPDGLIFVRHAQGTYADTVENFTLDYGAAPPALPAGMVGRIYDPGDRHVLLDARGNEFPQSGAFAAGDAIIAARGALIAAKAEREAPEE